MSGNQALADAPEIGDDMLILFPRDRRPTARRVRQECAAAAFADADGPDLAEYEHPIDIAPPSGLALQRSGLGFDLVGLAPGPAIPIPQTGSDEAMRETVLPSRSSAASLRLGPHIAAGRRSLAILREWFLLARGIAETFDGVAICWAPGGVAIDLERLSAHLDAWQTRGDVPAGLLASFRPTLDGAIQSHGLSYFTGQEFRIEPALVRGDEQALARLLFAHLFYAGKQDQVGQLATPDGYPLRLEPSANGRFVRVWPG
ncbi:MAG: hypothetical protein CL808_04145 [Citromicrobium sp.]|nr:hypothetical protein [Citromicrobium sp.]